MSRNKDRYESSNQRRQQVFMSPEDVAAGRKSNWTGVEITGVWRPKKIYHAVPKKDSLH